MAATSICLDSMVITKGPMLDSELDRLLRKRKLKELEIIMSIKPVPKMYKRGKGGHLYLHPATRTYQRAVTLCVANEINRYHWKSTKALSVRFEFYFATTRKYRWGQLKTTKPDLDNLIKSTMDGFSAMIGDDAKVAKLEEPKKVWAEENKVVIVLINQKGQHEKT